MCIRDRSSVKIYGCLLKIFAVHVIVISNAKGKLVLIVFNKGLRLFKAKDLVFKIDLKCKKRS